MSDLLYMGETTKRETIKDVLTNTNCFLKEVETLVDDINFSLYKPVPGGKSDIEREPSDFSMIDFVKAQRETAERILVKMQDIREGMW